MKICFYNPCHIGDIFFSQPFVIDICKKNHSVQFYYWVICGHIFYENMCDNLRYIEDIHSLKYTQHLENGEPPENISNGNDYLKQTMLRNGSEKLIVFEYSGEKYIGINTWCSALNNRNSEMELYGLLEGFNSSIRIIKDNYDIHLNNIIFNNYTDNTCYMPIIPNCEVEFYDMWVNEYKPKKRIFIYNYIGRSGGNNNYNFLAIELSKKYTDITFILPLYYPWFEGIPNIKTCDKDFGYFNDIQCYNLIQIEKIATSCDIIFTVCSGSAWIFFNRKINESSKKYMDSPGHISLINTWYKNCYNSDKDVVQFFDLNNVLSIIDTNYQTI
jgi:hypothetical protein